ncbi:hypothetical protein P378_00330 [Desulforamulus profundi]|uniref:CobQ/CobB/MinD/ParA nucleotide binding domain-containing protein n=1 Tax=Desulforamulus profundi TaxID=1383067 RepID=A0A2C6MJF6_9FIRM|nr:P-loop NTPase [Desulforamulus profundi]PHJ40002.1 hypothetical protein P378_00330 [Desulforamulus profundi]
MNWEQFEEERKQQLANQTVEKLKNQFPEWFNGNKLGPAVNIEEAKACLSELAKQNPEILPFEQEEITEKALGAITTSCLLLVEKEIAGDLLTALKSLAQFKHWYFTLKNSNYPDIVVFSRKYLNQQNLSLSKIRTFFPKSRVILLAGNLGDRATGEFIENAQSYGFNNIVTGDVPNTPGDRPYTLPVALMYDREEIGCWEIPARAPVEQPVVSKIPVKNTIKELPRREPLLNTLPDNKVEYITTEKEDRPAIPAQKLQTPVIKREEKTSTPDTRQQPILASQAFNTRGKLIISSSTKGGVGKTTIAITKAVALAHAGIKTCLLDFNLAAPDIATFFKIEGVPGIELLAANPFSPSLVMDVLVKVNEYLYVLPGPMDTTNPYFEDGKVGKILDFLLSQFPVLIADTPPEFWTDERLKELFERADRVYSILTQSSFSEEEAKDYAPQYIMCGVKPDQIGLILNMYDPELRDPRKIEASFSS